MLKTMQRYYLWADQIPSQTNIDQNPKDYFKSLLTKRGSVFCGYKKDDPGTIPQSVRTLFGFDFSVIQQHNQLTFALVKWCWRIHRQNVQDYNVEILLPELMS